MLFVILRNEAIASASLMSSRNGTEMENHVFSKAKTKEEYLSFVAKLIIHVRGSYIHIYCCCVSLSNMSCIL